MRKSTRTPVKMAAMAMRVRMRAMYALRWGEMCLVFMAQPSLSRFRKKFSVALMSMMNRKSTRAMENSA